MNAIWDCPSCGTQGILGLPNCPQCKKPRPDDKAPATPEPESESGTQAEASAGATPESQVELEEKSTKKGGGTDAKGK